MYHRFSRYSDAHLVGTAVRATKKDIYIELFFKIFFEIKLGKFLKELVRHHRMAGLCTLPIKTQKQKYTYLLADWIFEGLQEKHRSAIL